MTLMAPNLLPVRILFHATFAIVYLPIIIYPFVAWDVLFGGIALLGTLIGLGIFAALSVRSYDHTLCSA